MKAHALAWMVGIVSAGSLVGCDDDPTSPATTGSIEVTITTTGAGTDANGYDVTVAGETEEVDANDTVTFDDVPIGNRNVTLSDVANNCTVTGTNPRSVMVEEDEEATATFAVTCTAA